MRFFAPRGVPHLQAVKVCCLNAYKSIAFHLNDMYSSYQTALLGTLHNLSNHQIFSDFKRLNLEANEINLFNISFTKHQILRSKIERLQHLTEIDVALICPLNLENIADSLGSKYRVTRHHNFEHFYNCNVSQNQDTGSIVVLTNNVVANVGVDAVFAHLVRSPRDLIVIQDYDNHHWFQMSVTCLLLADIYIPSHFRLPPLFPQLLHHAFKVIPTGSIQWSRKFLIANQSLILSENRPIRILGRHSFYPQFSYRNRVISTFNVKFDDVGFIDSHRMFHNLSPMDRLLAWTQSSLHLIVPVADDIPIRFFDALITGGMPIVPLHLEARLLELGVPHHMFQTYGPLDLSEPERGVLRWSEAFEESGLRGVLDRSNYANLRWHTDAVMLQVLDSIWAQTRN